ncbi:MAG: hypothetical protein ACYTFG_02225 [Planctomycetota bacterium]
MKRGELEALAHQAKEAAESRGTREAWVARRRLIKETFGGLKSPVRNIITETEEDQRVLEQSTYRFRDLLYRYEDLSKGAIQVQALLVQLGKAWKAYVDETEFPNGLVVREGDIEEMIENLILWGETALRVRQV